MNALGQFFLQSSAYVVGKVAAEPEHEELAARWSSQRALDDAIGAIGSGHDDEALALLRNLRRDVRFLLDCWYA